MNVYSHIYCAVIDDAYTDTCKVSNFSNYTCIFGTNDFGNQQKMNIHNTFTFSLLLS